MDFHGLARRQLQALCKSNKIPANMTNFAMADALSALDNVEGIEEVMQPQSPEKGDSGSPQVPKTVIRTSTRARKPPVNVLESGGTASQSIVRTSRKLVHDDDKVEDEKKDVTNTPTLSVSKKRAPAAAFRKKAEVPPVQKVYSTRRSVRLVEKQLSELCLGESKTRTQPIKIDNELSSEMTENDVIGDNLDEVSNERSFKNVIDGDVNSGGVSDQVVEATDTASVFQGNEIASTVAAAFKIVEVVVESAPERFVMSNVEVSDLRVKEEVASADGEFDSVSVVEEASYNTSADRDELEKNINEVMKMETQDSKIDSVMPAASENGNASYLERKVELLVAEKRTDIFSGMDDEVVEPLENSTNDLKVQEQMEIDTVEICNYSEPELKKVEKKLDAQCRVSRETTDLVKEAPPPEAVTIGKENNVIAPKKALKDLSMGELRKMLKGMKMSNMDNKNKEVDANKHQDTPRPSRHALETLPCNTQV